MPWSYVNRDDFKNRNLANVGTADTADNTKIDLILQEVTRWIDEYVGRTFRTYTATLYFTANSGDLLLLDRDLISITSIKTDEDGDRTWERTWATTDYDLEPYNATTDEKPYTAIRITPQGNLAFPAGMRKGVEIAGKWGFNEATSSAGTLGAAISTTTATSVTMTGGHTVKPLHTIVVDSEQLFVTEVSSNTLTVKRGVNGTTAATHSNSASVSRYDYPDVISGACYIQAARILKRKDAPHGIAGIGDMGQVSFIPRLDPDVRGFLEPLRLLYVGAF